MFSLSLRRAARSASARICLANAADGLSLGLHATAEVRAIGDQIVTKFSALAVADQTDDGLMRAIDEACRGDFLPGYKRKASPFIGKNARTLASTKDGFTTVVKGNDIPRLVAKDDYDALCGRLLVTNLSTGAVRAGSFAEQQLMDRSPVARSQRQVKLAAGQQLGNPIAWMTWTSLVESIITTADSAGKNRAVAVTDALGIILPRCNPKDSALNQRFALHVPASVIARKAGFRPTFAEAGGYPRFKTRPIGSPPPAGWGATLDLGKLADGAGLGDGLSEITVWPITEADFEEKEFIELEYLGTVNAVRGESVGVDTDEAVAELLMDGRKVPETMRDCA